MFKGAKTWCTHVQTKHPEDIPEGFTPMRYLYGTITGKYSGSCMYCNKETEWNEATGKYGRICGSTQCREKYAEEHQLLSPEKQREMLQKRKISSVFDYNGVEMYYTGSYEYNFLKFMRDNMQWPASDIMSPSPNTYYYDYVNPEDKYHEGKKFYIPDFYIPSLNLEIEIKDQTTTHPKFLRIDKVKEACKDKKMEQLSNKVNYFKVNNNKFGEFIAYLEEMKTSFSDREILADRISSYRSIMSRATEGIEDREAYDLIARELNRWEEAEYWMNDTHLTLIHYCESLQELEDLRDEWDEMDEINKSISDTQSIHLYGMTNIEHYDYIKELLTESSAFLPHKFEAGGEGASESFTDIASEAMFFSSDDKELNYDKWGSDEDHNILWITGFSGSGKSTLAHSMKSENIEVIELDDFFTKGINIHEAVKNDSMDLYKKVGLKLDEIQHHWDTNGYTNTKVITPQLDSIIDDIISLSKENYGKKKYIVEGIQVYDFVRRELLKGQPMLIKGTSAMRSLKNAGKRNKEGFSTFIKNIMPYSKSNKMLKDFYKDMIGTEGYVKAYTMEVIDTFNDVALEASVEEVYNMINTVASVTSVYNLHIELRIDEEIVKSDVLEVPIFYINTCTLPLYFDKNIGLTTAKNITHLFLGIINNYLDNVDVEYKQCAAAITHRDINVKFLDWREHDENCRKVKLNKVTSLEVLMELVDTFTVMENERVDEREGVIQIPNPTGKELKEAVNGIYELPLRINLHRDYCIPMVMQLIYNSANGFYTEHLEPYLGDIKKLHQDWNRVLSSIKIPVEARNDLQLFLNRLLYIKNTNDLESISEECELMYKKSSNLLEEYFWPNIEPHIVVKYQLLIEELARLRTEAIIRELCAYFDKHRPAMYTRIIIENREKIANIISNMSGKVLFVSPYPEVLEAIHFKNLIGEDKYDCALEASVMNGDITDNYDAVFVLGITPDENNEYTYPYEGKLNVKKTFVITLFTGNLLNLSSNIVDAVRDMNTTLHFIDQFEIGRLLGYEKYTADIDYDHSAMEALLFDRVIKINADEIHYKKGYNSVVMITDREEFCRKQPILIGYEKVEFVNMDDILIGVRNERYANQIQKYYKNYTVMAKKYFKHHYDNYGASYKTYKAMSDDLYDHNDEVMRAIVNIINENTTTIYVLYGLSFIKYFINCTVNSPLIIDDMSYIRFKMTKNNSDSNIVSKLFVDDEERSHNIQRLIKASKPIIPSKVKVAKGTITDPIFYHISKDPDLQALVPKVPASMMFGENMIIPRSCVSTTVDGCLTGIPSSRIKEGAVFYVYKVRLVRGSKYYKPSTDEVPDQEYTNEHWILTDALLEFVYGIVVTDIIRDNRGFMTDVKGIRNTDKRVLDKIKENGIEWFKSKLGYSGQEETIVRFGH